MSELATKLQTKIQIYKQQIEEAEVNTYYCGGKFVSVYLDWRVSHFSKIWANLFKFLQ